MASSAPHLHLLAPADKGPQLGLGPARGVPCPPLRPVRTAAGRPWDELAPWWLPDNAAVKGLRKAALAYGVRFDIAVSVTLERSLAARELDAVRDDLARQVDALAASARLASPLTGPVGLYLRQLSGQDAPTRQTFPPSAPVSLPARLTARLSALPPQHVIRLLHGELSLALAWERAAVAQARTIGEWSSIQALMLLTGYAARPSAAPQPTGI